MSDPYRPHCEPIDTESKMSFERRKLARQIIAEVCAAESIAESRQAWAWFDQKGVGLLREALDEIDHLEAVLAARAL